MDREAVSEKQHNNKVKKRSVNMKNILPRHHQRSESAHYNFLTVRSCLDSQEHTVYIHRLNP